MSHGQRPTGYADFASVVMNMGYTLVPYASGPLTSAILNNYDIVVLALPRTALASSEITALQTWVKNGGKLVVIYEWGDYSEIISNLNDLCSPFGFQFNNDCLYDPTDYDRYEWWIRFHRFGKHQITSGLSEIWMLATCSITITNPRIAQGLVFGDEDTSSYYIAKEGGRSSGADFSHALKKSAGAFVVAAASTYAKGRVVCLGDSDVFELGDVSDADGDSLPDLFEYDNAQFLQNILNWLTPTPVSEWTFMVYIDADGYMGNGTPLDSYAFQDINEMEKVGSTDKVNVIVYLDRIGIEGTQIYYIHKDEDPNVITSPVISSAGELNSGDPHALADFVNWVMDKFPAKRYALILLNHGRGWREKITPYKGVCWDVTANDDCLTMNELKEAFRHLHASLDLLGFMACLMGMVEVAYEVRDYAKMMVASEEPIPGPSWPFDDILKELANKPTMDATTLGKTIVSCYSRFYKNRWTLSAIDLKNVPILVKDISNLAIELQKNWARYRTQIINARENAEQMQEAPDYIDLVSFTRKLTMPKTLKDAAGRVTSSLKRSVIAYASGGRECYGLTIYFPTTPPTEADYTEYRTLDFTRATRWDKFLSIYLGIPG